MEQEKTCGTCLHFRRHYVKLTDHIYNAIDCGHCVCPRLKPRRADTVACWRYEEISTAEGGDGTS